MSKIGDDLKEGLEEALKLSRNPKFRKMIKDKVAGKHEIDGARVTVPDTDERYSNPFAWS